MNPADGDYQFRVLNKWQSYNSQDIIQEEIACPIQEAIPASPAIPNLVEFLSRAKQKNQTKK